MKKHNLYADGLPTACFCVRIKKAWDDGNHRQAAGVKAGHFLRCYYTMVASG